MKQYYDYKKEIIALALEGKTPNDIAKSISEDYVAYCTAKQIANFLNVHNVEFVPTYDRVKPIKKWQRTDEDNFLPSWIIHCIRCYGNCYVANTKEDVINLYISKLKKIGYNCRFRKANNLDFVLEVI